MGIAKVIKKAFVIMPRVVASNKELAFSGMVII
jgi:hypothetical protein